MGFSEGMSEAARLAESAVHETMMQHRQGRITDEDDITPDLLAALRIGLTGQIGGLRWLSSVVRHRKGKAAEEARTGADMLISVVLRTPSESYAKGVLVQAKRVGPGNDMSQAGMAGLKDQCSKMLAISPSAFVFDYSPYGMRVGSAVRIAGTSNPRLHDVCVWTPYRFFLELFRCPIGDPRLRTALVADLPIPELRIRVGDAADAAD